MNSIGFDRFNAVNKILRDLKMFGIISEDSVGELRPFLNALWVVGWENGRQERYITNQKVVGQYKDGKLINTFSCAAKAAKMTGFTARGIKNAIYRETPTRQGWIWKYI